MNKFSFYSKPIGNCYPSKEISISDLNKIVTSERYKEHTQKIQAMDNKNEKREYKSQNLDYITPSGTFTYRSADKIKEYSGHISIDLDGFQSKEEVNNAKMLLANDPYLVFGFTSPSGLGLKLLFSAKFEKNINIKDKNIFGEFVKIVFDYVKDTYKFNINYDIGTRDICRAAFLCYDPKPIHKKNSNSFMFFYTRDATENLFLNYGLNVSFFDAGTQRHQNIESNFAGFLLKYDHEPELRKYIIERWERIHERDNWKTWYNAKAELNTLQLQRWFKEFNLLTISKIHEQMVYKLHDVPTAAKVITKPETKDKITIDYNEKDKNDFSFIAKTIANIIKDNDGFFYMPYFSKYVEIKEIEDKTYIEELRAKVVSNDVTKERLLNMISEKCRFIKTTYSRKGETIEHETKMRLNDVAILMANSHFYNNLRQLDEVKSFPYLYIHKDGSLKYEFQGYCENLHTYFVKNTPNIKLVPEDVAIKELDKILTGFCFENEEDKAMAIAFLITPALRGMYRNPTERTPVFAIMANQARAGKDYLAGVRSIIYLGERIDHVPFSDGENNNQEELRKKVTSLLMLGTPTFHSANNKGYLQNAFLEMLTTSETISERLLGKNQIKTLDNKMDYSFSANIGLQWPEDFDGRIRRINLFFPEENPNARVFPIPDLHGYIKNNRSHILSCIYSLIAGWYKGKMPNQDGKVFTSYYKWAKICGGLMEYYNLGNPLIEQEDDSISGNPDDRTMKAVFTLMVTYQKVMNLQSVKSSDIIKAVELYQGYNSEDERKLNGFGNLDDMEINEINISSKSDKLVFGKLLTKYRRRILKGIHFRIVKKHNRASRREYFFEENYQAN